MIELVRIAPGEKVRAWMQRIPETPFYSPQQAIKDAKSGAMAVLGVKVNGEPSAVLLLAATGKTLEVVALAGSLGDREGMPELIRQLRQIAINRGLEGVACRTARPGMGRRLIKFGWKAVETIYWIGV